MKKETYRVTTVNGREISRMKISSGPVGQNATPGSRVFDFLNCLFVTLVALTMITT